MLDVLPSFCKLAMLLEGIVILPLFCHGLPPFHPLGG